MSLMVVMARESARAIVVIRDLHASAPAQLIARKPLQECELAHLPAKRSAEDAVVAPLAPNAPVRPARIRRRAGWIRCRHIAGRARNTRRCDCGRDAWLHRARCRLLPPTRPRRASSGFWWRRPR